MPKGFISAGHWLPQNHSAYIRGKANKDAPGTQSIRVGFGSHPTRAELFLVPINAVQGTDLMAATPPCQHHAGLLQLNLRCWKSDQAGQQAAVKPNLMLQLCHAQHTGCQHVSPVAPSPLLQHMLHAISACFHRTQRSCLLPLSCCPSHADV